MHRFGINAELSLRVKINAHSSYFDLKTCICTAQYANSSLHDSSHCSFNIAKCQAKLENINQYTTMSLLLIKLRDFHERFLSKLIK